MHLLDDGDRPVHAGLDLLLLRALELPVPALELAPDVALSPGQVAQADGVHVQRVQGDEHVDEVLSGPAPGALVQDALRLGRGPQHVPVHVAHHVERAAVHRRLVAEPDRLRDGHRRRA
ncbi:MAG TPA: hypothetical protein VLW53_22775, partial [Candidatus Eisenbacteria bacterium]|nr:hypothetical protein [Candidatus Eisenbacteria bacterium]